MLSCLQAFFFLQRCKMQISVSLRGGSGRSQGLMNVVFFFFPKKQLKKKYPVLDLQSSVFRTEDEGLHHVLDFPAWEHLECLD